MKHNIQRTAIIAVTLLAIAGCGGAKKDATQGNATAASPPQGAADLSGAPKWILGPCERAFKTETPQLCGVGTVQGMTNFSLARAAAQARGRTEIAQKLEVKIRSVLTDYQSQSTTTTVDSSGATTASSESRDAQSSTTDAGGSSAVSDQQIEQTTKQITEMTLNGSAMAESWLSPNGSFFVLMVLDSAAFAATVQKMSNLDPSLKQVVLDNIPKLFSDYDE